MLMSDPDAATAKWLTTTPPDVSSVALATAVALPAAAVSLAMALAVATPEADAPNEVADNVKVAAAAPGAATVPDSRNLSFGLAPSAVVWASATVLRKAVEWVTAMTDSPLGRCP